MILEISVYRIVLNMFYYYLHLSLHTRRMIAIDSNDKNLGYRTSSLTMLSKTSSSSSPGNGDSPTSISKISTPRPHQSTALVYDVSVKTKNDQASYVIEYYFKTPCNLHTFK